MTTLRSTAELLDSGTSSREIHRLVRSGRLVRVHPGYFTDAAPYRELRPEERMLLRYEAFCRAASVPPVLCLASAALVLDLRLRRVPTRIHTISAPEHGTHNGYAGVVRHQAILPESDVTQVEGIKLTSGERTLLDCARYLPFVDAVVLADQAHRFGLSRARLEGRLTEWRGQRGVRRARAVLRAMDTRSESVGETLARLMLAESGLPTPELQWVVRGRTGSYRVDFAWPECMLVLEFDGEVKYADPGTIATVIRAERRREVEIQEQGWTVLRIGWDDVVRTPHDTVARIEAAMRQAAGGR
ncbi:type IV toxin-antitoxin system AbiEi family antitoxin domain-containing protein [Kocuria sabuli]|uniref:type IV toxin-antitoxin system AbiEi family antitoxin domain-containing protein n=1 Tax=Kocuria sabuli TaxID=3071448 RepID=UPI0034D5E7DC